MPALQDLSGSNAFEVRVPVLSLQANSYRLMKKEKEIHYQCQSKKMVPNCGCFLLKKYFFVFSNLIHNPQGLDRVGITHSRYYARTRNSKHSDSEIESSCKSDQSHRFIGV